MNRALALLVVFCASLCLSCTALTQASPPPFVFSEPEVLRFETNRIDQVSLVVNLWERTYAVPGNTITEVGNNLNALRRAGSGHGPYSASTKWDLKLGLRYADTPEGCRIANATVEIAGVVTLPALASTGALAGHEIARWQTFIANLEAHELLHVDNEVQGARRLQAALLAMAPLETCRAVGEAANALAIAAEQAIVEADTRLDAETKHGALTGATFP